MWNLFLAMWPIWVALIASGIIALIERNQQLDADIDRVLSSFPGLGDWDTDLDFEAHVQSAIEVTR